MNFAEIKTAGEAFAFLDQNGGVLVDASGDEWWRDPEAGSYHGSWCDPDYDIRADGTWPDKCNLRFELQADQPFVEWRAPETSPDLLTCWEDPKWRKEHPIARGALLYFPDALMEVSHVSFKANEQHNPGQPMHWHYGKSNDHLDCEVRHMIDPKTVDIDNLRHKAKKAWRALADLQEELEKESPRLHELRQAQRDRAAKGEY